ncbi:hypothetical protein I4F81_002454 [Pyropia yezoensis]|uniref:Uncharacterized protein n=1 Tax=Pyropia yezoensis TaxID=2788 RepID=A0ACC3BPF3_PYRYE|nr:hypothetical protein I4F81_002454 [Neopyropia yezoensis]
MWRAGAQAGRQGGQGRAGHLPRCHGCSSWRLCLGHGAAANAVGGRALPRGYRGQGNAGPAGPRRRPPAPGPGASATGGRHAGGHANLCGGPLSSNACKEAPLVGVRAASPPCPECGFGESVRLHPWRPSGAPRSRHAGVGQDARPVAGSFGSHWRGGAWPPQSSGMARAASRRCSSAGCHGWCRWPRQPGFLPAVYRRRGGDVFSVSTRHGRRGRGASGGLGKEAGRRWTCTGPQWKRLCVPGGGTDAARAGWPAVGARPVAPDGRRRPGTVCRTVGSTG